MKMFVGTKILKARPMTLGDYNDYRGWPLPENEDGSSAGYLVEYLDGGKANDERHSGYISWSPAVQFEKAYIDLADDAIQALTGDLILDGKPPHLTRLLAERAQLADRLVKLKAFIGLQTAHHNNDGDLDQTIADKLNTVPKVPHAQWRLLVEQSLIMTQLLSVLDKRVVAATIAQ